MLIRVAALVFGCCALAACGTDRAPSRNGPASTAGAAAPRHEPGARASAPEPLVIGESFTVASAIMGEVRRVNVLVPTVYGEKIDAPMPVLYMPDGGVDEDFLHIAGLVQVLVSNGGVRPFMLVGIQNTSRRRDLTGPTSSAEDRKIAPVVGGSATFRRFIREELMPAVRSRYRTTGEAAIIGESLAGLFVVETYFLEPALFRTYIAVDPSLWWNGEELVKSAGGRLGAAPREQAALFIASSNEPGMVELASRLAKEFEAHGGGAGFQYVPSPTESHGTIYHSAALRGLRAMLGQRPAGEK